MLREFGGIQGDFGRHPGLGSRHFGVGLEWSQFQL